MPTKSLTFDIFGRDRSATRTIHGVQAAATGLGSTFTKVGAAIGLALSARALIDYGRDAVTAFADAEKAQMKLADAFARFPKLADTSVKALQGLNTQLMLKTGFDDDATASGQAVLAQFDLTGDQLKKLTPLLQDYARKTDQDLPAAAESLGKALLGQGRALKDIGIDFVDTGTIAGNFDELVAGLTDKVGGFAVAYGQTAPGKLDIFNQKMGEVQERIGSALLEPMGQVVDMLEKDFLPKFEEFANWLTTDGVEGLKDFASWIDVNGPIVLGLGAAVVAAWALNAALNVNPIVLAFTGLVAAFSWLSLNINTMTSDWNGFLSQQANFGAIAKDIFLDISAAITNFNIGAINSVIGLMNGVLSAWTGFMRGIGLNVGLVQLSPLSSVTPGQLNSTYGARYSNDILGNSILSGPNMPAGSGSVSGGRPNIRAAAGALLRPIPGGHSMTVAEAGASEAVLPLTDAVLGTLGDAIAAASSGGRGTTTNFTIVNPDPHVVVNAVMQRLRGGLSAHG